MNEPITIALPVGVFVAAERAISSGIEYAEMALTEHEANLGRSTLKNLVWAERMDLDLREMKEAQRLLKAALAHIPRT